MKSGSSEGEKQDFVRIDPSGLQVVRGLAPVVFFGPVSGRE